MKKKTVSLGCTVEPLCHILPVDNIPNGLDVVGANILVLEVVGMLPDINAKQRNQTCSE